jgi:hypothetical protein
VVASKNVGFQLLPPKAKFFRFENYCRMREFIQIMEHGWNLPSNQTDLAIKKGFEVLREWHSNLQSLGKTIKNNKLIINLFDSLEEFIDLSLRMECKKNSPTKSRISTSTA